MCSTSQGQWLFGPPALSCSDTGLLGIFHPKILACEGWSLCPPISKQVLGINASVVHDNYFTEALQRFTRVDY